MFGFGVPIKMGTNENKLTPTNYNYFRDPNELRWKHIDELYGQVNNNAINTYNFKFYFYNTYYMYTSQKPYQIDLFHKSWQDGSSCYSYNVVSRQVGIK